MRLYGGRGCFRLAIRWMQLGRFFLLLYGLAVAASASLVMANLGTLFRLRLLFWLPLLILVAAGDPLGSYGWYRTLVQWGRPWRSRSRLVPGSAAQPVVQTLPVSVGGPPEERAD
jgi:hypothetical protein